MLQRELKLYLFSFRSLHPSEKFFSWFCFSWSAWGEDKPSTLAKQKKQVICLFVLRYLKYSHYKHMLCSNGTRNVHSLKFILLLCIFRKIFLKMVIANQLSLSYKRCTGEFALWSSVAYFKWTRYSWKTLWSLGWELKNERRDTLRNSSRPFIGIAHYTTEDSEIFLPCCCCTGPQDFHLSVKKGHGIPCNVQDFFLVILCFL